MRKLDKHHIHDVRASADPPAGALSCRTVSNSALKTRTGQLVQQTPAAPGGHTRPVHQTAAGAELQRRQHHPPAHAVQGLREDLRRHAVLVLQDQALLQGHRHGRAVFGAFAAGESNPVESPTDLSSRSQTCRFRPGRGFQRPWSQLWSPLRGPPNPRVPTRVPESGLLTRSLINH